jgi:hypothetical protein
VVVVVVEVEEEQLSSRCDADVIVQTGNHSVGCDDHLSARSCTKAAPTRERAVDLDADRVPRVDVLCGRLRRADNVGSAEQRDRECEGVSVAWVSRTGKLIMHVISVRVGLKLFD